MVNFSVGHQIILGRFLETKPRRNLPLFVPLKANPTKIPHHGVRFTGLSCRVPGGHPVASFRNLTPNDIFRRHQFCHSHCAYGFFPARDRQRGTICWPWECNAVLSNGSAMDLLSSFGLMPAASRRHLQRPHYRMHLDRTDDICEGLDRNRRKGPRMAHVMIRLN